MFRQLNAQKLHEGAIAAAALISERYPRSGLAQVAHEVASVAGDAVQLSARLARPVWPARLFAVFVTVALGTLLIVVARSLRVNMTVENASDLVQGIEALINDIIFAGIAVWFVFSLETRVKRRHALALIGELRSLSHVIDLHQLTKDPTPLQTAGDASDGPPLSPQLMAKYLDHCSDLLSMLGKLAALCAQRFNDPVTLSAVKELEDLSNGLARKIWQKIVIIERIELASPTRLSSPA